MSVALCTIQMLRSHVRYRPRLCCSDLCYSDLFLMMLPNQNKNCRINSGLSPYPFGYHSSYPLDCHLDLLLRVLDIPAFTTTTASKVIHSAIVSICVIEGISLSYIGGLAAFAWASLRRASSLHKWGDTTRCAYKFQLGED